jgi:putative MATE family efflux protein
MKKEVDLTKIDLKSAVFHLALPMMAGGFLINTFAIVDLFFVGKLGYMALAGLSVSVMVLTIITIFTTGVTTGTVALISHFVGKKDYDSANQVLWQTIILSLIFWLLLAIVGLFGIEFLLKVFGAKGEVLTTAKPYLRVSFLTSGFLFLHVTLNQSMRGAGDAKTPMYVLIVANIINLILDPLLIFGLWIFPRMEVAGSAITTAVSRLIGFSIIMVILFRRKEGLRLNLKHFGAKFIYIKRIISVGFFSSMQLLMNNISLLFLTRLVALHGPEALAAYGVGTKIRMLLVVPGFGFANASAILMGQNMGADKKKRAKDSMMFAIKMFEILLLPAVLLIFILAPQIVSLFNNNSVVMSTGATYLRYIMVTFPFLGVSMIMQRGLTGVGDTAFPTVIVGFFSLFLRIPLAYLLSLKTSLGTSGVWLGINAADIFLCFAILAYFNSGRWKRVYSHHRRLLEET